MAVAALSGAEGVFISLIPRPARFTGRNPEHSIICVTQGLIDNMDRELQGVIGHEMSHIADYDIRTMTTVAVLVGGIAMLSDFMTAQAPSQYGSRSAPVGTGIVAIVMILRSGWSRRFSRRRSRSLASMRVSEHPADASVAVHSGRCPAAPQRVPRQVPQPRRRARTAHLFIVNPLAANADDEGGFFANLFSTHPPRAKGSNACRRCWMRPATAAPASDCG